MPGRVLSNRSAATSATTNLRASIDCLFDPYDKKISGSKDVFNAILMGLHKRQYIYQTNKPIIPLTVSKTSAVLVLPVYSHNQAFLSIINLNCKMLVAKSPAVNWTIVIVNDGSPVQVTKRQLQKELTAPVRFLYYHYTENKGKGYAVRFGLLKAGDADIFMYTDYDFPFGSLALVRAATLLAIGQFDVVTGDRGEDYIKLLPYSRKLLTRGTRLINRRLLGMRCTDTQGGMKAFNNRGMPAMLYTGINGFLFDLAFIREIEKQDLRLAKLPVYCAPGIKMRNFSLRTLLKELRNLVLILLDNAPAFSSVCTGEKLISDHRIPAPTPHSNSTTVELALTS